MLEAVLKHVNGHPAKFREEILFGFIIGFRICDRFRVCNKAYNGDYNRVYRATGMLGLRRPVLGRVLELGLQYGGLHYP